MILKRHTDHQKRSAIPVIFIRVANDEIHTRVDLRASLLPVRHV